MSVDDRLRLLEEIWSTLEDDLSLPVPDWQTEEVQARLRALEDGSSLGRPWAEVRQKILSKP